MIWIFELERALFRLFLALMCLSMLRRVWRTLWARPRPRPAPPLEWPVVTVQLPIRDEEGVAERVVRAACALDYPADRLEVQVLDDSDGSATRERLDRVVDELAASGIAVSILRRGDRRGFKAGNLAAGLRAARGELIAIFDADAVPPRDFLRRTVPFLCADARVGLVQTRHTFDNRDANLVTRAQALLLDALMLVEQVGQAARERPLHFNGSAGVWRRATIEQAGGWRLEISAEDLDLSHRAALAGWRFVHLTDVTVATELPERMAAVRVQQERWTRGKVEALRRLWTAIRHSSLPPGHRVDVLLPVAGRLLFPFLAILTLTMPLTTFDVVRTRVHYSVAEGAGILGALTLCAALYYGRAARLAGRSIFEALALVPAVMALLIGLSLSSSWAWIRGLFGRRPQFTPTPKRGEGPPVSARLPRAERIGAVVEIFIGCSYLAFTGLAAGRHLWGAMAFFAFIALSWLWVSLGSLWSQLAA